MEAVIVLSFLVCQVLMSPHQPQNPYEARKDQNNRDILRWLPETPFLQWPQQLLQPWLSHFQGGIIMKLCEQLNLFSDFWLNYLLCVRLSLTLWEDHQNPPNREWYRHQVNSKFSHYNSLESHVLWDKSPFPTGQVMRKSVHFLLEVRCMF